MSCGVLSTIYNTFCYFTEFNATLVDIEDEENHHPVPIEREKADRFYLRLAVGWLIFVVLMTILKSKPVVDFVQYLNSRFHKPPPVVLAEDHERDD